MAGSGHAYAKASAGKLSVFRFSPGFFHGNRSEAVSFQEDILRLWIVWSGNPNSYFLA
jgi:hypothetical protein